MKIVALPQPWAGAAVGGILECLSMPIRPRGRDQEYLIKARGIDRSVGRETAAGRQLWRGAHQDRQLGEATDGILGLVRVRRGVRGDECDLPFATGPWVWLIDTPLVFPDPVDWPSVRVGTIGDIEPDHETLDLAIRNALEPAQWRWMMNMRKLDAASDAEVFGDHNVKGRLL